MLDFESSPRKSPEAEMPIKPQVGIIAESTRKVVTSVTLVTGHKSKYSMFYTLKTEIGFKN